MAILTTTSEKEISDLSQKLTLLRQKAVLPRDYEDQNIDDDIRLDVTQIIPENIQGSIFFNSGTIADKNSYLPLLVPLAEAGFLVTSPVLRKRGFTRSDHLVQDCATIDALIRMNLKEYGQTDSQIMHAAHSLGGPIIAAASNQKSPNDPTYVSLGKPIVLNAFYGYETFSHPAGLTGIASRIMDWKHIERELADHPLKVPARYLMGNWDAFVGTCFPWNNYAFEREFKSGGKGEVRKEWIPHLGNRLPIPWIFNFNGKLEGEVVDDMTNFYNKSVSQGASLTPASNLAYYTHPDMGKKVLKTIKAN